MPYVLNTNNAILCSLLHTSATLNVSASYRRDLEAFSKGMPSLKWAANPRVFTIIDLTLAVPLAYAAYRVYKNGGGFENTETAWALGYCGVNMLASFATAFNSKKIKKFEIFVYANIFSSAVATMLAFFKIDSVAGFCFAPYALWTGCYFLFESFLRNKQMQDKKG